MHSTHGTSRGETAAPDLAAAIAASPVLTAMHAMLAQPESLADAALNAATAEGPDYTDGFIAALNLTGLADLKDFFTSLVVKAATELAGVSISDFVGAGQPATGGAR